MIIRQDGSVIWLETGGAPVGMFADWIYENFLMGCRECDFCSDCPMKAQERTVQINTRGAKKHEIHFDDDGYERGR
jgi:hypothetical protein